MSTTPHSLEPLLKENPNRFVIFPIQYQDIWDLATKHRETFWNETEIDLSTDLEDWRILNESEKHFIKNVLAFFAAADGIVSENLASRFYNEVQIPEARVFYSFQGMMEQIHGITYSILLDTYVQNAKEKDILFRSLETIPCVRKKGLWAQKWIESQENFATRLVAFACVEGIFFSGSFCCIYWMKERGLLKGLCQSNDLIARDEGLHCEFAVLLYNKYIQNKLTDAQIHDIVREALVIEEEFILDSIPCRLLGMNSDMMRQYVCFVANRLVRQLGHSPLYAENPPKNPFPFMERICFSSKTNFFERETTQYRISVGAMHEFDENADF